MPVTEQSSREMQIEGREVEGSLRVFKFPEILQFLSMGKRTGILGLSQDDRRVEVSFKDGKINNVIAKDRYVTLGQMLVYSGHLTRESLAKALDIQQAGGGTKFLGEILIENNLIGMDQLKASIKLQLEEELWDLFSWENGNFRFEQGAARSSGAIEIGLDVAALLQEGNRRLQEWMVLRSNISDSAEIFQINPDFAGPPEQPLDDKTWRVLSLVNGRLPVDALVRFSNLGKFETYWALDHLLKAEIITRAGAEPRMNDQERLNATVRMSAGADGALPVAGTKEKKAAKPAKSGKLGFFGKRKQSEEEIPDVAHLEDPNAPREFLTDIGLLCAGINSVLKTLQAEPVFSAVAGADWLEWMWRMAEQRHPRADAIKFQGDRLSSDLYDQYARIEGSITRALTGMHEDCVAALRVFWNRLEEKAREARGNNPSTAELFDRVDRHFSQATAAICTPDFKFHHWRIEERGGPSRPAR